MKRFFGKIKSLFWGDEKLKGGSAVFVIIMVVSTFALLISNIIANRLIPLWGWQINGQYVTLTAGVLCFGISYICSDILSEVYGYSVSRRAAWLAFGCNLVMVGLFCLADAMPVASVVFGQAEYANSFHTVLGIDFSPNDMSPIGAWGPFGCLCASLVAFIFGSLVDDVVFEGIRKLTSKGKDSKFKFVVRAIGSSFAGELIDSIIFIPLMYFFNGIIGYYTFDTVVAMILIQVSIKTLYEIVISPLTSVIASKLKKYEASHMSEGNVVSDQVKEIIE